MASEIIRTTATEWEMPAQGKEAGNFRDKVKELGRGALDVAKWPFRVLLASVLIYGVQDAGAKVYEHMNTDANLRDAVEAAEKEPQAKALLDAQEIAISKHFASLSPEEKAKKAEDITAYVADYINNAGFDWRGDVKGLMDPKMVSPDGRSFNIDGTDFSLATLTSPKGTKSYTIAGKVSEGDDGKLNIIKPTWVGSSEVGEWNKTNVKKALARSRQDGAANIMAAVRSESDREIAFADDLSQ